MEVSCCKQPFSEIFSMAYEMSVYWRYITSDLKEALVWMSKQLLKCIYSGTGSWDITYFSSI